MKFSKVVDKIIGLFNSESKRNVVCFALANVLYSISTFIVNLVLPFVIDANFYSRFIYVFQMVLFMTGVTQFGIIMGLYRYIRQDRKSALNIYYLLLTCIYLLLLIMGCINNNIVNQLIKLGNLTYSENFMFYAALIVSSMYVYNKGKNVADKAYKYMMRVTLSAFGIRTAILLLLFIVRIESLSVALFLLFVLPFAQDIKDYAVNAVKYVRPAKVEKTMLQSFLYYSLRVWLIGALFMVSDKIFLISTKGLNVQFTTAIAFSAGFLGIISLFNQTFQNYFISNLSPDDPQHISNYIKRVKKLAVPYFAMLLGVVFVFCGLVYVFYERLGLIAVAVLFVTLLRAGFIAYWGMFSLLSKVMNLLNIELVLGLVRIVIVYCLCSFWHTDNLLLWYTIVLFVIPFPEIILSVMACRKVGNK